MAENLQEQDEDRKDEIEESQGSISEEDLAGVYYIGDVDESNSSSTYLPDFFGMNTSNIPSSNGQSDALGEESKLEEQPSKSERHDKDPRSSDSCFDVSSSHEDPSTALIESVDEVVEANIAAAPESAAQELPSDESGNTKSIGGETDLLAVATLQTPSAAEIEALPNKSLVDDASSNEISTEGDLTDPRITIDAQSLAVLQKDQDEIDDKEATATSDINPNTLVLDPAAVPEAQDEHHAPGVPDIADELGIESDQNGVDLESAAESNISDTALNNTMVPGEDPAAADSHDEIVGSEVTELKDSHCEEKDCITLLSALGDEVGLALDELLSDEPEKKLVPSEHQSTTKEASTAKATPSSRQPKTASTPKVSVRSQRPSKSSKPLGQSVKSPSPARSSGFKARPLPKYLSQGPPKLNMREFKPTIQVPFRLRTEERFLSRPANCACCIDKRNKLLMSRHRHETKEDASPTDVMSSPLETKAKCEPTASPVRPTKLEERFLDV